MPKSSTSTAEAVEVLKVRSIMPSEVVATVMTPGYVAEILDLRRLDIGALVLIAVESGEGAQELRQFENTLEPSRYHREHPDPWVILRAP